jgi:hypothetical protein
LADEVYNRFLIELLVPVVFLLGLTDGFNQRGVLLDGAFAPALQDLPVPGQLV